MRRPLGQHVELILGGRVKQASAGASRLLQPLQANVVAPSLEQRESHGLVGKSAGKKGKILPHQLFLQCDGIRGDDRAFAIRRGPAQRRHEIAERLANAGAGLEQSDAAERVQARHAHRHLTLARTILVLAERGEVHGHGTTGSQQRARRRGVERHVRARTRHFDHHVQLCRGIVDDCEPDAVSMYARRNFEVGVRRLKHSGRMVVHQHFPGLRESGKCEYAAHVTACDGPGADDHAVSVHLAREAHLVPRGKHDGRADRFGGPCGHAISAGAHVLSGFFLAAGNSTLFRISR